MINSKKSEVLKLLDSYRYFGIEYIDAINCKLNKNISKLPNTIDELIMDVSHCSLCDLSKSDEKFVYGVGDSLSNIYIIGTNHYLFKSNQVMQTFKDMIEKVLLLKFNDVYLTNIVKCSTKENITQFHNAVDACENYIYKQIEIAKPKIIITLDFAFNLFMKSDEKLMDVTGNIYDYNGIKLIPLLHPEFVYKNPSYKQRMFKDLTKIKNLLEKL